MVFICRKKCLCLFSGKAAAVRILQKKFCYPVQEPRGVLNPWPNPCILWTNPLSTYFLDRKNLKKEIWKNPIRKKEKGTPWDWKKSILYYSNYLFFCLPKLQIKTTNIVSENFWLLERKKEKILLLHTICANLTRIFWKKPKPSKFHFYKHGLDGYIGLQIAPTTAKQF